MLASLKIVSLKYKDLGRTSSHGFECGTAAAAVLASAASSKDRQEELTNRDRKALKFPSGRLHRARCIVNPIERFGLTVYY